MRSERRKKIMTLSILLVSVLVISVGFAAFSSTLIIKSKATINPNPTLFDVKLSKTNSVPITTGSVAPTLYPSSETTGLSREIIASNMMIDGSTTLSELNVTFVSPGDYITYKLYIVNEGAYAAYLNRINFIETKTCTALGDTQDSLVQAACSGISVTVSVAGTQYTETTQIQNHKLNKQTGEEVLITLKYDSNASRADGPFTVKIGKISLIYSTIDDPTIEQAACKYNTDSNGYEMVTCDTENFYVIEKTATEVKMLAQYNLTLSTTEPKQDPNDTGNISTNAIKFAESIYWNTSSSLNYDIYSNQSNAYPYIEAYRNVLKDLGIVVQDARLISYEQLQNLGCQDSNCSAAPKWLASSSYWLGFSSENQPTSLSKDSSYFSVCGLDGSCGNAPYYIYGVRPVITISTSSVK